MEILNEESSPSVMSTVDVAEGTGIEPSCRKRKGEDDVKEEEKKILPGLDKRVVVPMEEYIDILLLDRKVPISCHAPGCTREFKTTSAYDEHYAARHLYKCGICRKSLPTEFFLELHVLETHDTFFGLMTERKPMYSCLAEECQSKFKSAEERYVHFHEDHKEHKSFSLFKQFEDLSKSVQKSRESHKKERTRSKKSGYKKNNVDVHMSEETEMSTNHSDKIGPGTEKKKSTPDQQNTSKLPSDISFGRHVPKFRYWSQQKTSAPPVNECSMDMSAIRESLDVAESPTCEVSAAQTNQND